MGNDDLNCGNCDARKEHEVMKLEIKMLHGKTADLEDGIDDCLKAIESVKVYSGAELQAQLKEVKDYFNSSIEKLKGDIKSLFSEQRQLRESIIEIKNTVERAYDRTALKVDNLERTISELLTEKRDKKTTFTNPLIIAIVVLIIGYLLGKYVK